MRTGNYRSQKYSRRFVKEEGGKEALREGFVVSNRNSDKNRWKRYKSAPPEEVDLTLDTELKNHNPVEVHHDGLEW